MEPNEGLPPLDKLTYARPVAQIAALRDCFAQLLMDSVPGFELGSRAREVMAGAFGALSFVLGVKGQEEVVENLKSLERALREFGITDQDGNSINLTDYPHLADY